MNNSQFFWDHSTLIIGCILLSIAIPVGIILFHDQLIFDQNKEASLESDINGLPCNWLEKLYNQDKGLWLNLNQKLDDKIHQRMVELKC